MKNNITMQLINFTNQVRHKKDFLKNSRLLLNYLNQIIRLEPEYSFTAR